MEDSVKFSYSVSRVIVKEAAWQCQRLQLTYGLSIVIVKEAVWQTPAAAPYLRPFYSYCEGSSVANASNCRSGFIQTRQVVLANTSTEIPATEFSS